MKENVKAKKDIKYKMGLELFWKVGSDSVKYILHNRKLRILLISILLSSFAFICINSYTTKFIEISLGAKYIGLIISISSISSILFTMLINKVFDLKKFYICWGSLGSIALILIGILNVIWLFVVLFILQVVGLANFDIQRQTEINSAVNKNRATSLSAFSLIGSVSGVWGTLLFGIVADKYGIPTSYSVSGILMLLSVLILYLC